MISRVNHIENPGTQEAEEPGAKEQGDQTLRKVKMIKMIITQ